MLYTLADAKVSCAPKVGAGRCADDPEVVKVLNEATQLLLYEGDWMYTRRIIRFHIRNRHIAMPEGVEAVLNMDSGTWPGNVFGMAYEFMDSGPGALVCGNIGYANDLVDRGHGWPTFFSIGDTPRQVMAVSTAASDVDKTIHIRGLNQKKEEINPAGSPPGEELRIFQWDGGIEGMIDGDTMVMSENSFLEIKQIIKPETEGYISFFARDPTTHEIWFLGKYAPYETQPGYRRYQITGTTYAQCECIICLVKMGYIPLRHDTDLLTIQHLKALQMQCMAIHQFNNGDLQKGLQYQGVATRMLGKQLSNANRSTSQIDFVMDEYGIGTGPNIISG